mmetsp:Transcript_20306/g.66048  ORF Transcript_20306/g.66048 Transcript_20306/m.66048 type:complete len:202 (+) Transcript_20306:548-1153(+)
MGGGRAGDDNGSITIEHSKSSSTCTCFSTRSAMRARVCVESGCPRDSPTDCAAVSTGIPPSTRTPHCFSTTCVRSPMRAAPPALFSTTPDRRRSSSNTLKPFTTAAALRVKAKQSTTKTTLAPSHLAISAVLAHSPSTPSKRPMLPSMTATSAPAAARRTVSTFLSLLSNHPSRLKAGVPAAAESNRKSAKSGPTLKGCTR